MADSPDTTTPSRRLFLMSGSAATVFAALGALARSAPNTPLVVASYIADMRAAGYQLAPFGDVYSIRPPDRSGFGEDMTEIGERYAHARRADPAFHDRVAAALRAEG